MKSLRQAFAVVFLTCGLIGVIACIAAIYETWQIAHRLDGASTRVFDRIDRALARAHDGVTRAGERARDSRITSEELGQLLRDRARLEAARQLAERWELEARSAQLALRLQQVDAGFQTADQAIDFVQLLREANELSDDSAASDHFQDLQDQLSKLREAVRRAGGVVEEVRELTGQLARGETPEQRAVRIAAWLVRILAVIAEIDRHLADLAGRLNDLQARARQLGADTSSRIRITALGLTALFIWLAAGQSALARLGWKWMRGWEREKGGGSHSARNGGRVGSR